MTTTANHPRSAASVAPTPNDQIQALTGRRHLSWSQLTSFRGCPRRWQFSHVEQREPSFVSSSLVLGSAFHAAAEHHYQQVLAGQNTTAPELHDVFDHALSQDPDDHGSTNPPIRYGRGEDHDTLRELGHRMLTAFYASALASPPGTVIGVEETLLGSLHPDLPDLLARIDVAWQNDDGSIHVMDLKTSRSKWSDASVRSAADQLHVYGTLAQAWAEDNRPIQLHFGVVTKAKSPTVQILDPPEEQQPDSDGEANGRLADTMLPVWHAMRAGVDYASPNPMNCAGCGYRDRCPAHVSAD